jgi:hypothetical protein
MLGNVLPGLRELRAPLAGGYLWLLFAWMVWGDKLPSNGAEKADALDRLYRLEPVISSIGLAVVASVAAYTVGSIAIDVLAGIGRRIGNLVDRVDTSAPDSYVSKWTAQIEGRRATRDVWTRVDANLAISDAARALWREQWRGRPRTGILALTEAGNRMLEPWVSARAYELREEFEDRIISDLRAANEIAQNRDAPEPGAMDFRFLQKDALTLLWSAVQFDPPSDVERAARDYIVSNRDLLKTRLIDASQPLHSEFDRPDAEATFRMALWPRSRPSSSTSHSK